MPGWCGMARGRMISNDITKDKRINDLSDDTSRLAFTWLITFADCEGRTYGDPALVRSMLFPRRLDITAEMMEIYIREWHHAGLIIWYQIDNDWFISFPAFDKHQVGLRKDRETPSQFPAPLQSNSGVIPDEIGLIKVNGIKENRSGTESIPPRPNIFGIYESVIGSIPQFIVDELTDAEKENPPEWIEDAFREAAAHNKRNWAYVRAILKNWKNNGYKTKKKAEADKPEIFAESW